MKKCLPLLCFLLILLLSACGGKEEKADSSGEIHPHAFTEWGFDATHHFMRCECGERNKVATHDTIEDDFCETCGFFIYAADDGSYSIRIPNAYGSIDHQMDFDAHDKLVYDWHAEYEYYDDRNPKHMKEYVDGVLQSEQTFLLCENPKNGDVYLAEEIYYAEDGSQEFLQYDEHCNVLSVTMTDSVGEIVTQDVYTYEFDADGNCIHETISTNGIPSLEMFYQPDADGSFYPYRYTYYTETGEIESEFYYDAFGNEIS